MPKSRIKGHTPVWRGLWEEAMGPIRHLTGLSQRVQGLAEFLFKTAQGAHSSETFWDALRG